MRVWAQDLTRDFETDQPTTWGGIWRHGRGTVSFGSRETQDFRQIGASWNLLGPSFCGAHVDLDWDDYTLTLSGQVPWIASIWLHFNGRSLDRIRDLLLPKYEGRTLSVSFHGGVLHWTIWKDPHCWSREDGWRNSSFDVITKLLGRVEYSEVLIEEREVLIPMPEGSYPATAQLYHSCRRRPRWFPAYFKRVNIDVTEGLVPFPGKGENSWDCGPDGCSSMSTPASSIGEGIGKFVGSVLGRRRRYGGSELTTA